MEKLLKDNAGKITDADKAPILAAIENVKHAASGTDVNAVNQACENPQQASHAMAQHRYKSGPSDPGPSGPGGPEGPAPGASGNGQSGKEDVIDAEFEVKK